MTDQNIAFITGANRGIGLETARQLGKQGIAVVLGARDLSKGEAAAAQLKGEGIDAAAIHYDAADAGSPKKAYEFFDKNYGKLDILINNAAIYKADASDGKVSELPEPLLRKTLDTNLFGVIALTQALLPLIRLAPAGRIFNMSSGLGSLGKRTDGDHPLKGSGSFSYNVSKTAINAFTVHLAEELENTPIKVNAADPGWVKTDMGGPNAELEIADGAKTSVRLATLPAEGPTRRYFHMDALLPW